MIDSRYTSTLLDVGPARTICPHPWSFKRHCTWSADLEEQSVECLRGFSAHEAGHTETDGDTVLLAERLTGLMVLVYARAEGRRRVLLSGSMLVVDSVAAVMGWYGMRGERDRGLGQSCVVSADPKMRALSISCLRESASSGSAVAAVAQW